jgi:hypothetical protein
MVSTDCFSACSPDGANWISASADQTDIEDCITAADPGDTISIPADAASAWTGRTEVTKANLIFQGNGYAKTLARLELVLLGFILMDQAKQLGFLL